MPEGTADGQTTSTLLPDRECGSCNVCCVALTIDDPELKKVQGVRCPNAMRDNRCAIYEARPQTCRRFNCGWRQLKWVRKTLRPDRSGVLVRLQGEVKEDGSKRLGIVVTLLSKAALEADGLAETVAAGIAAGVPVWLIVPGPPGYTSAQTKLNDALGDAVAYKSKDAVLAILREAYRRGRSGPRERILLTPATRGMPATYTPAKA